VARMSLLNLATSLQICLRDSGAGGALTLAVLQQHLMAAITPARPALGCHLHNLTLYVLNITQNIHTVNTQFQESGHNA
jgi:hypothetical protein